jgi:hypothetical protein
MTTLSKTSPILRFPSANAMNGPTTLRRYRPMSAISSFRPSSFSKPAVASEQGARQAADPGKLIRSASTT